MSDWCVTFLLFMRSIYFPVHCSWDLYLTNFFPLYGPGNILRCYFSLYVPLCNSSFWPFSTDLDTLQCIVLFCQCSWCHELNIIDDLDAAFHSCNQNEVFRCYESKGNKPPKPGRSMLLLLKANLHYVFICDYQLFVRLIAVSLFHEAVFLSNANPFGWLQWNRCVLNNHHLERRDKNHTPGGHFRPIYTCRKKKRSSHLICSLTEKSKPTAKPAEYWSPNHQWSMATNATQETDVSGY